MQKTLILLVLVLLSPLSASAGWTRGGLFGADARALIVDPRNPDTLFLGTSKGDVYVSKDAAGTWSTPRSGTPFPGFIVDNLMIDTRGRLWAACWGLWGGGVVAVSSDGGATWSRRDKGLEDFSVRAIAIDPQNADLIVLGGLTGVHKSLDSGKTWTKISDQINVESLAIDPRNADRIFVGTWRQAWRTDDGGITWKHIANGMVLDTDVFTISIDPKNPDNVWASTCGWVYNSPDGGDTWTRFKEGFNNRRIHDIDLDPSDTNCVYAGSVAGLYRTSNLGLNWELVTDESLVINSIVLHPERPGRIILATEGDGVYISGDRGKTFKRSNIGLYNVRVAAIVADARREGTVYAAVLFGNAASGIYRSLDHGKSWERISKTKLPEIRSLVIQDDPDAPLLVGTEKGFFWSRDGVEWTQSEPVTSPIRVERIIPYSRVRLFAATAEGVYTSKDAGLNWYRLAELADRTVDIAVGSLGGSKALYALTSSGLAVFDGAAWSPVEGAPQKGRALAIRKDEGMETVVIASLQGLKSGHVDFKKKWHDAAVPEGLFTALFQTGNGGHETVLVSSKDKQPQILVRRPGTAQWRRITVPEVDAKEIVAISSDPTVAGRFYVATSGRGVLLFDDVRSGDTQPLQAGGSK